MILQQAPQSLLQHLTKIRFLEAEKEQQSDYIKGLEYSLLLNKAAMKEFTELLNGKYQGEDESRVFLRAIQGLQKEKDIIRSQNLRLQELVEGLKCQLFINSQVKEESDQEYLSVMKSYEQKILELRRVIQDKEFAIQEREVERKEKMNIHEDVFPRYDLVNMQIKAEETLRLARLLTSENNKLYGQIKCICQQLENTDMTVSEADTLQKSTEKILGLKIKVEKIRIYFNNLEEKRSLLKSNMDNPSPRPLNYSKQNLNTARGSSKGAKNQCVNSSLRQLLFKQKKNNEILKKQLEQHWIKLKQLKTTNKLLTQSNINYQSKREQIKTQLLHYKTKYQDLMNLIIVTRNTSGTRAIWKQMRKEEIIEKSPHPFSFKKQKIQILEGRIAKQQKQKDFTSSIIRHSEAGCRLKRSTSCVLDDVFIEKIKEYRQEQGEVSSLGIEQSFIEPFSINYSVIHPN